MRRRWGRSHPCRCVHGALLQYCAVYHAVLHGHLEGYPTMLKHQRSLTAVFPLATLALAGCLGYRTPMVDPNAGEPASPQARKDAGVEPAGKDAQPANVCPVDKRYVLVLGDDGQLYRFETDTMGLTSLAKVSCGNSTLNSMTVSPLGPAYISSQTGDLCSVDRKTFQAARTAFSPLLVMSNSYGMALLPDSSAAGQTLYIAVKENDVPPDRLERIDLATFVLSDIGYISPTVPSAELTAGPNGELYGFAVGTTDSLLLNIDPKTASAIDVTKVPAGFEKGAFALVHWQDAFYLFLGRAGGISSTVYRYRKGDTQVTTVGTIGALIIGAGVACAND